LGAPSGNSASTSSKASTKHPACAAFFAIGQLEGAMGGGATIVLDRQTAVPNFHGFYPGFPYSFCTYGWPTGAATEPDNGLAETYWPAYVGVAWGVTRKAWGAQRASQAARPDTSCSGCVYQPQRSVKICKGCAAYVETYAYANAPASEPNVDTLIVWTKHHNVLWVVVWPAPLSTVTGLVKQLLVRVPSL